MTNKKKMIGAKIGGLIALGFSMFASESAYADRAACSPNLIESSTGTLIVQCSGTNYYAAVSPPSGCGPAQTVDTLRAMQSLAQAALLANKNLQIYYTAAPCSANTFTYFYAVDLVR